MSPMFLVLLALIDDDEDRERLARYYNEHRFSMLYVARSILHDHVLAEDAVHEAFFRVAKKIKDIRDDPKEVRSYLTTTVTNAAKDILNKQKVVPILSLEAILYEAADPSNIEDDVTQSDEMSAAVQMVLSLPVKYSSVFLMRYKQDFSDKDIAQQLGISEAAVRKRLQRAKEKIKEAVRKKGVDHYA